MKLKQAVAILAEHNKWRRAQGKYSEIGTRPPYTPTEISVAIDTITKHFSNDRKTITADDVAKIADIIGHTAKLDENGYVRFSRERYQEIADKFNEIR